jgi:hypothetical protein
MNQTIRKPAQMNALDVTGAYMHDSQWRSEVAFETEDGQERLFTVLIAQDTLCEIDFSATTGIAVIDTASGLTVCDGICAKASPSMIPAMDQRLSYNLIEAMEWPAFSAFMRDRTTYRGGFPDIDAGTSDPDAAVPHAGASDAAQAKRDLRSADLKAMNMSTDVLYSFPVASRAKMVSDISSHKIYAGDGESGLCWDIRMKFRWNATGVAKRSIHIDEDMNAAWAEVSAPGSDIFKACTTEAISPYIADGFVPLERENASDIVLEQRGTNGGFLVMTKIAGQDIAFNNREELDVILDALSDREICDLWASCRVLDVDLGRAARAEEMEWRMQDARQEFEVAAYAHHSVDEEDLENEFAM